VVELNAMHLAYDNPRAACALHRWGVQSAINVLLDVA
jgi:hypothetical protein